jgi:murein L,D-transpeptidase YcbB/YkuD
MHLYAKNLCHVSRRVATDGLLNFRDDIYGHDKKMAERLFEDEGIN